jgi:hypothetical protein
MEWWSPQWSSGFIIVELKSKDIDGHVKNAKDARE